MHLNYSNIYNKYKPLKLSINVIPTNMSSYYYNIGGEGEPLRYVVYKQAPDTIGNGTTPTSYRQAMMMPGARSYKFTQSCRRVRLCLVGIKRELLTSASFTLDDCNPHRMSMRAPWFSTILPEDRTLNAPIFGWQVWFPQLRGPDTLQPPTFEVMSAIHVRYCCGANVDNNPSEGIDEVDGIMENLVISE